MPPPHRASELPASPLALHLRTLRQFHGSASLGQAELAALACIPVRQLRALETTRCLPPSLRRWCALADALHCSLDELVGRRPADSGRRVVGLVCRSDVAVAVCCTESHVLEVRRLGRQRRRRQTGAALAADLATDYGASLVVTDRDDGNSDGLAPSVLTTCSETVARIGLMPGTPTALAMWALATDERLERFVRFSKRTGWLQLDDRVSGRVLLAAAYAFAHARDHPVDGGQLQLPFNT